MMKSLHRKRTETCVEGGDKKVRYRRYNAPALCLLDLIDGVLLINMDAIKEINSFCEGISDWIISQRIPFADKPSSAQVKTLDALAIELCYLGKRLAMQSPNDATADFVFKTGARLLDVLPTSKFFVDWESLRSDDFVLQNPSWRCYILVSLISFEEFRDSAVTELIELPLQGQDSPLREIMFMAFFRGEIEVPDRLLKKIAEKVKSSTFEFSSLRAESELIRESNIFLQMHR